MKGLTIARGIDSATYLQFVDNSFSMGEASIREARIIISVIASYRKAYG